MTLSIFQSVFNASPAGISGPLNYAYMSFCYRKTDNIVLADNTWTPRDVIFLARSNSQRSVVEDMQRLMDSYQRLHQQEETYIRNIASAAESAVKNSQSSRKATEAVAAIAAGIQASNADSARQQITAGQLASQSADSLRAMSQSITADITSAAQRLERSAGELDSNLARTIGDSLAMMDDSISRLTSCLNGVNSAANNVTQAMKSLPKTVSGVDSDIKATSKTIDTELKLLLKAVSDTQKSLTKFSADLERRADLS